MAPTSDSRTSWAALPEAVHRHVEEILGGTVVSAVSQVDGFSPGSADRVETSSGRRAFVKAIARDRNPGGFDLHRREIRVMESLPPTVSAPNLLGSFDDGNWVALLLDDIDGHHPGRSRDGSDTVAVLDAFATFPRLEATKSAGFPRVADEIADEAAGWQKLLAEEALEGLPGWVEDSLDRLILIAAEAPSAVDGEHLQHLDSRADNILIDAAGTAWIIDWPWAGIGARWVDGLMYLFDARVRGETIDAGALLDSHPLFDGVPARRIDSVLAAMTGGFLYKASQPAPPHMPTLRSFQKAEGLAGVAWLQERWG